jgi:CheY-like chemotaxis protein
MSEKLLLYIEDNFHNRQIVGKILASRGFTTLEAENGERGLEMVRTRQPRLILLDITLPGMDGIEVAATLRADPDYRRLPIIAVTAAAMRGDRERILAAGCDEYIAKPIDATLLIETVEKLYQV